MLGVLGNTWALMLGMLLLMISNGLQGTLLGVRGSLENIDQTLMGIVMSGYFVGMIAGSHYTPWMLRRVGHVRVFAALGSIVSAVFLLYPVLVGPFEWTIMRVVVGFCFSGIYVVSESWLNDSSSNDMRGQALSLYLIVQMIGIVVGQVLLNVADPGGYLPFLMISILMSLSIAPILLSVSPAPVFETAKPMSLRQLVEASPLGVATAVGAGGMFSALFGMSAVYATEQGMNLAEVSIFTASIYLGGMVLQGPIGWISDRMDRRWLIIVVALMGLCSAIVPIFYSVPQVILYAVVFVIGGAANPLYSLAISHTNDFLEKEQMASASSGLVLFTGVGAMGGPLVVGLIMDAFGSEGFFAYLATLMALIVIYALYRTTQRSTVDDTAPHIPGMSVRTSTVGTEVATEIAIEAYEEQLEEAEKAL